jgi:ribulose-5-phosphate 4-epimerase/fuculose-1-phosphate aldolase
VNKDLSIVNFQTFYASKEASNCPLIPSVVRLGKKLKDKSFADVTVSLKFGKRVLINAIDTDIGQIEREDFLEIVDYDPVKNVLLLLGQGDPKIESPIHWFIHHARDEVNAVIQVKNEIMAEKLEKKFPSTSDEHPMGTIEHIKDILKTLRDSKKVVIKNQGLLCVGNTVEEAEKLVLDECGRLK